MGDTGANMAHWAGLYGSSAPAEAAAGGGPGPGSVSSPTSGGSGGTGSPTRALHKHQQQQPGVEGGRVGKPARRRSRASRRAPVTLLNTDTSNFRAMVQQFTGIPAGPYGPGAGGGGGGGAPVISFGAGGPEYGAAPLVVRPSPTSAVMSFDNLPAPAPSLQGQQQQQQLFRPQHQYGHGGGYGEVAPFFHGFEPSAEERLLLQSMQAAQMMPARPAPTTNNAAGNGYSFG